MSKLIDKLEMASQPAPKRMGFVTSAAEAATPPLVLVIRLDADSAGLIKDTSDSADAVILQTNSVDKNKTPFKDLGKLQDSIPWGVQINGMSLEAVGSVRDAGCDYLVFGIEDTPAAVLNEENIGKVLSIGLSLEDYLMRVLEDTPTDAVVIEVEPPERLTVKDLMAYRSILSCVSKPVLVRTGMGIQEEELAALQNAGISGIVVEPRNGRDMKLVSKIRKAIEALPPREAGEPRRVETLLAQSSPGPNMSESFPDDE